MIDLYALIKSTNAFKTIIGDKKSGRLSHAYLFLTPDGQNLTEYLKIFASVMTCADEESCGNCRTCKLIKNNTFSDVLVYPRENQTINTEEVNDIIAESFLKPIEIDKKIFILTDAQNMNIQAQNKLLKTLEEPPKNVHILIGATSEFPLLPTIKSRVKKLEIAPFSKEILFEAMRDDFADEQKLKMAIACSDGTVGRAKVLYEDNDLSKVTDIVCQVICEMQSSKDLLKYSTLIINSKCDLDNFLSLLELVLRDMLIAKQNLQRLMFNPSAYQRVKNAQGFSTGALINAIESVEEAQKRKKFNANPTMLIEWVLFQILEGKYKWQKL